MSNCNTPTCLIDGKITPERPDGSPMTRGAGAPDDADAGCTDRGPARGDRRGRGDRRAGTPPTSVRIAVDTPPPPGRIVPIARQPAPEQPGRPQPAMEVVPRRTQPEGVVPEPAPRRPVQTDGIPTTGGKGGGGGPAPLSADAVDPGAAAGGKRPGAVVVVEGSAIGNRNSPGRVAVDTKGETLDGKGGGGATDAYRDPGAGKGQGDGGGSLGSLTMVMRPDGNVSTMLSELTAANPTLNLDAVKAAGAVASPDACYRTYLQLPPELQARIITAGTLGRYGFAQAVARDIRTGSTTAAKTGADWLFTTFPRDALPVAEFCTAVAYAGPAPAGYAARPAPLAVAPAQLYAGDPWMTRAAGALAPPAAVAVMQSPDGWTRAGFSPDVFAFAPAGGFAIIDDGTAQQVFALLPPAAQIEVLRGAAFAGEAYPAALADVLARGASLVDGVPVADLLAAHMGARYPEDSPRRVLFRFAVQDAQRATRPAGNVESRPGATTTTTPAPSSVVRTTTATPTTTIRTGGGDNKSGGTAQTITAATPGAAGGSGAGASAAGASSEFLAAAGLNSAQWAAIMRDRPEVGAQLLREYQNRPNTFAQVAGTVLQAVNAIILGVHQGAVDDLAATNASYAHQQAMAQLALQRDQNQQQSAIALANAQAQQAAAAAQQALVPGQIAPPAPIVYQQPAPPAPQQQPATGMGTGTMVALGVGFLALLGGGAYFFTRKQRKANRRPRRAAKRNRRRGRARKGNR